MTNPELQKIDDQINAIITDIAAADAGLIVLKENLKTLRKKRKQIEKLYDKITDVMGDTGKTPTVTPEQIEGTCK